MRSEGAGHSMIAAMTDHLLDRPILSALRTRHASICRRRTSRAFRYPADVSPFAAVTDDSGEALAALAGSSGSWPQCHRGCSATRSPVPPGTVAEHVVDAVQMLAATVAAPDGEFPFLELSDADAAEMLALATLTKPGPFMSRTHDFGGYIGIRVEGRLVAMAGHRLQGAGLHRGQRRLHASRFPRAGAMRAS